MLLLGPVYITNHVMPWHFGDFCYILLPNIGEDQTNSYHPRVEPLGLCHMVNPALITALRSEKG